MWKSFNFNYFKTCGKSFLKLFCGKRTLNKHFKFLLLVSQNLPRVVMKYHEMLLFVLDSARRIIESRIWKLTVSSFLSTASSSWKVSLRMLSHFEASVQIWIMSTVDRPYIVALTFMMTGAAAACLSFVLNLLVKTYQTVKCQQQNKKRTQLKIN